MENVSTISDLDMEWAESEILKSLTQNTKLRDLRATSLFQGDGARESFKILLCNIASIQSVRQSNHTLQKIMIDYKDVTCQQYVELNKNPNKKKVIQEKMMQFYFAGDFDASAIADTPLAILAHILGLDVQKKQSAVYNILKSVPELCNVLNRKDSTRKKC